MEKTLLNGHDGFRADHAGGSGWTQLKVARLIAGFGRYKIAVAPGAAGQTAVAIDQGDCGSAGAGSSTSHACSCQVVPATTSRERRPVRSDGAASTSWVAFNRQWRVASSPGQQAASCGPAWITSTAIAPFSIRTSLTCIRSPSAAVAVFVLHGVIGLVTGFGTSYGPVLIGIDAFLVLLAVERITAQQFCRLVHP